MTNDSRLKLHEDLCDALGTRNVYFQPPESIKMKYPAIVYTRSDIHNRYASDELYDQYVKYTVTVLDHDPDSEIVKKIAKLKFTTYNRHYVANGLNHDQFTISYKK